MLCAVAGGCLIMPGWLFKGIGLAFALATLLILLADKRRASTA
jgi:hypothetical protein